MRLIYHLVPRAVWERAPAGDYRADSLTTEGFIHLSNADQVSATANRYYADTEALVLLHVDASLLTSRLLDEPAASGELFPHVYGPINRSAIVAVQPMHRAPNGAWILDLDSANHLN